MICKRCGGNNREDFVFCTFCGVRRMDMEDGAAKMRYCVHCGGEVDELGGFCTRCGEMQPTGSDANGAEASKLHIFDAEEKQREEEEKKEEAIYMPENTLEPIIHRESGYVPEPEYVPQPEEVYVKGKPAKKEKKPKKEKKVKKKKRGAGAFGAVLAVVLGLAIIGAGVVMMTNSAVQEYVIREVFGMAYQPDPEDYDASGSCGQNLMWYLDRASSTLIIAGSGDMEKYTEEKQAPWERHRADILALELWDGVTSVGDWAFAKCSELQQISIAPSVTKIGQSAFASCQKLKRVSIPGSVQIVNTLAFSDCILLTEVTMEKGLEAIGHGAFSGCRELKKITIPSSVTQLGDEVFYGCMKLEKIVVDTGNEMYTSKDGVLFAAKDQALLQYPAGKKDETYTVAEDTAIIRSSAFAGCANLKEVTISEGVTVIESKAFESCAQLKKITLPESLTAIESHTFENCIALKTLTVGTGVNMIGTAACSGCEKLTKIIYLGTDEQWENIQIKLPNDEILNADIQFK